MTLNQLSEKFLDFETKNNLFNYELNDIYYWDYIRYSIHVELSLKSNTDEIPYIYKKKSFKKKLFNNLKNLANLFIMVIKTLFLIVCYILKRPKYDIIFLAVGGRTLVDGVHCNRYCYFHLKELVSYKKILVIETELHKDKSFKEIGCDYICIPLKFIKILNIFNPTKNKYKNEAVKINSLIKNYFGSEQDIGKVMGVLKSKHSDSLDFSKVSSIIKGLLT